MSDTGFLDGWAEQDTNEAPPPPPVKKKKVETNVWGEEIAQPTIDTEGLTLEEIEKMEAENNQFNKDLQDSKNDEVPIGYSGAGSSPAESPVASPTELLPQSVGHQPASLEAIERARYAQRHIKKASHVFCGIVGPPKSGKSSVVYDSLTDEEAASGAEIWSSDYDGHGRASVAANYAHRADNILIINPYVIHKEDGRVPYDFPATHLNQVRILQSALRQLDRQDAYYDKYGKMPEKWLKTVVLDGAGTFLKVCELCMKISDLGLGADAIETASQKATTSVGRSNWYIRSNYFMAVLDLLKELSRRGVHAYVITHFKPAYDSTGNEIVGGEGNPHWLPRDTEKSLTQIIYMDIVEERDDTGRRTGVSHSTAILKSSGVSLKSTEPVTIYRQDPSGGEWFGWSGLRDGSFSTEGGNSADESP